MTPCRLRQLDRTMKKIVYGLGALLFSAVADAGEDLDYHLRVPSSHWGEVDVDVFEDSEAGYPVGLSGEIQLALQLNEHESQRVLKAIKLVMQWTLKQQRAHYTAWQKAGEEGNIRFTIDPLSSLRFKEALYRDLVDLLGERRATFLYKRLQVEGQERSLLQGIGDYAIELEYQADGTIAGASVVQKEVSDRPQYSYRQIPEYGWQPKFDVDALKVMPKAENPGLHFTFHSDSVVEVNRECGVEMYTEKEGLNPDFFEFLPLKRKQRNLLMMYLQRKEQEYHQEVMKKVVKKTDHLGGLHIEIPQHRQFGIRFARAMVAEIEKEYGKEIVKLFEGIGDIDENGFAAGDYAMAKYFYDFGVPEMYVFRGGEKEDRPEVIPLDQFWVQFAEGDPHNAYDCTLTIDPYDELPRYLRKLVTYQEVSGFRGKGHAEKETLLENKVISREVK